MSDSTTRKIELIVTDLDGTLLDSKSQLSDRNVTVLKQAMEQGVRVMLATGKTYPSAKDIIARLGLTTPGIFSQGLAIYTAAGSVTHQETLDPVVARQVITFAEDRGFNVVAYAGTRILTRSLFPYAEKLHTQYHEPMPEGIGGLQNILDEMAVNKLIIMRQGEPRRIKALRWQLEKQLDGRARLLQSSLKDMLEVLPSGGSKGAAMRVVAKEMGVSLANILAIGDGENDVEMVQMAGLGVAVSNADDHLKAVADEIVASNDEDGVAEAVERFVLGTSATESSSAAGVEQEGESA